MTATFHRVPIPQPRETAFGYFRRFAAAMSFESLRSFEHVAGLHEFGPTSGDDAWARLATITGMNPEELSTLRWSLPGGSLGQDVVIAGTPIRRRALILKRLRVCPSCLRGDGGDDEIGDVRRTHRREWALRHVVACPEHGTLLVDTCTCGIHFEAVGRSRRWACGCGMAMAKLPVTPATDHQIRAASAIEAMLGGDEADLPPPFRHLEADTFLAFLDRYGRAARSGPDAPRNSRKLKPGRLGEQQEPALEVCAGDVDAAMRIVEDWPRGFYRLLHAVAGRNLESDAAVRKLALFATDAGHAVLGPLLDIDDVPVRFVDRRVRFWLLAEHGYRHGERHAVPIGFWERRNTVLPGRERKPPESLSAAGAAMMLEGIAERERMKDWAATGLIEPDHQGNFSFEDVDAILYTLLHAVAPREPHREYVSLRSMSLRKVGGAYPRAQIIADVMQGRLYAHAEVEQPNLSHIWVDAGLLKRRIQNQRVLDMAAKDLWYPASTVAKTIKAAWPAAAELNADVIRAMRTVRARHIEKWRDGDCQNYHVYSVTDVLTTLVEQLGAGHATGPCDTALDELASSYIA